MSEWESDNVNDRSTDDDEVDMAWQAKMHIAMISIMQIMFILSVCSSHYFSNMHIIQINGSRRTGSIAIGDMNVSMCATANRWAFILFPFFFCSLSLDFVRVKCTMP